MYTIRSRLNKCYNLLEIQENGFDKYLEVTNQLKITLCYNTGDWRSVLQPKYNIHTLQFIEPFRMIYRMAAISQCKVQNNVAKCIHA